MNVSAITADRHARQFVKFVLVGLLTTAINFAVFAMLLFAGVHYLVAAVTAFLIATFNSYTWNRIWTFRAGHHRHQRLVKFTIIQSTGLAVNLSVLALLVEYAGWPALLAQLGANACVVVTNFTGNKFWTFRE